MRITTGLGWTIAASIAMLAGCGSDGEQGSTGTGGSGGGGTTTGAATTGTGSTSTGASMSTSTGAGGSASGVRTLDNCGTTIGAGVPDFYKKYFRCVDVSMANGDVVIKTINLPPHKSPYYPKTDPNWEAFDTQGGTHFQNPNQLSQQSYSMTVTTNPVAKGVVINKTLVDGQGGTSIDEYHPKPTGTPGVSLDGVAMFHGVAAPGDDLAMQAHTFDLYEGHPEMTGAYHYHGASAGPLEVLLSAGLVKSAKPGAAEIELYGIMCDGTLLLGCTELDGSAVDTSGFDAQNGHVHDISDGATTHFQKRYHTHVCPGKFTGDAFSPEIQYYVKCG